MEPARHSFELMMGILEQEREQLVAAQAAGRQLGRVAILGGLVNVNRLTRNGLERAREWTKYHGKRVLVWYLVLAYSLDHVINLYVINLYILLRLLIWHWSDLIELNAHWFILLTLVFCLLFVLWGCLVWRYSLPFHHGMFHVLPGMTRLQTRTFLYVTMTGVKRVYDRSNMLIDERRSLWLNYLFVKILARYNEMCEFDQRTFVVRHLFGHEIGSVIMAYLPSGDAFINKLDLDLHDFQS